MPTSNRRTIDDTIEMTTKSNVVPTAASFREAQLYCKA